MDGIGKTLSGLRTAQGWSTRDAADRAQGVARARFGRAEGLGLEGAALWFWEGERRAPSPLQLDVLAEALGADEAERGRLLALLPSLEARLRMGPADEPEQAA